ncbi:unnamed protein product [Chrysoparadoxa australica]
MVYGPKDEEETKKVAELRKVAETLPHYNAEWVSDMTLTRYLRANELNIGPAAKQLEQGLEWRSTPEHAHPCQACVANPQSHDMRIVGMTPDGRAVLYTSFASALHRFDANKNSAHLSWVSLQAERILDSQKRHHQWVSVIDFHGFSAWDCNPASAMMAAKLLSQFPERLNASILVDSPRVFSPIWKALKPMLKAATANKISFVKRKVCLQKFEELGIGEEMIKWLGKEMEVNRTSAAHKGEGRKYWVVDDERGHDPRGAESCCWRTSSEHKFQLEGLIAA